MALLQKPMRFAILILFLCSCANSSPPSPESSQAPVEASYQEDDASPKLQEGTNRDQLESAEVTNAAIASANRGDMEAAMALLAMATTLDPENDNAWFTWGQIYEQQQDYRAAVDAFGRAVELIRFRRQLLTTLPT